MTAAEFDASLLANLERVAAKNEQIRAQTRTLRDLLERKQRLAARLETTLTEMITEQETINIEISRLLTSEEQRTFAGHLVA